MFQSEAVQSTYQGVLLGEKGLDIEWQQDTRGLTAVSQADEGYFRMSMGEAAAEGGFTEAAGQELFPVIARAGKAITGWQWRFRRALVKGAGACGG